MEAAGNGVKLERLSPQEVKQMEPEAPGKGLICEDFVDEKSRMRLATRNDEANGVLLSSLI